MWPATILPVIGGSLTFGCRTRRLLLVVLSVTWRLGPGG